MGNTDPTYDDAAIVTGHRGSRLPFLGVLVVAGYTAAHSLVFLASPLGRFPVLDGLENVALANQIASGSLPAEPFYRGMLYPGLLSLFLRVGIPAASLPILAAVLGCLLHLGSTLCVYQLARRAWGNERAGLVAAGLFGLNPVAVYFSAELLDTTFALFLFLTGFNLLHQALTPQVPFTQVGTGINRGFTGSVAIGTTAMVLAMLARPHYAIVVAGLPFILIALLWRSRSLLFQALVGFLLVAGLLLGTTGLIQYHLCGQFRIMPAQGAYSLWAGNRPGANGRYFQQQIHIPAGGNEKAENPARIESEQLYRAATGLRGSVSLDVVNAYWKKKTVEAIRAHPVVWLGLMARKAYYLLNNFEQYNNKTFAVQKGLSPVLRFNPLGWGVTLVLCAAGGAMAFGGRRAKRVEDPLCRKQARKEQSARGRAQSKTSGSAVALDEMPSGFDLSSGALSDSEPATNPCMGRKFLGLWFAAVVAALYAVGVILFFVSDRFRLPLLPFLCVGAGVWGCASRDWFDATFRIRAMMVLAVAALAALLTFSRVWGVFDLQPAVQDYVLLSIASEKCGRDMEALAWARRALAQRPEHPDALACAVTSFYNAKLQGAAPEKEFPDESWDLQAQRVAQIPQPAPGVRLVEGVSLWKIGRHTEAKKVLHSLLDQTNAASGADSRALITSDDSLGVLLLTKMDDAHADELVKERLNNTTSFYLLVGVERRHSAFTPMAASRVATAAQAEPFVRNIFP